MLITRKIEFDAGHRIPDHKSKCRNVHGHRYTLHATVRGDLKQEVGKSDTGMVVDFGDLKQIMVETIGDPWDHAFLVFAGDEIMIKALAMLDEYRPEVLKITTEGYSLGHKHKTVVLPKVPTVENLVDIVAVQMHSVLQRRSITGFSLHHVRLYETPNCWADWYEV